MNIFCFGISHQTASLKIRERFAVAHSALPEFLTKLIRVPAIGEVVLLSTCNRTEFYVVSHDAHLAAEPLFEDIFGKVRPGDCQHLFRLSLVQTVRHLFRVASGLESMVVGETEIFGQVKRAYEEAVRLGATGKILNRLFQKAFHVGKLVRSSMAITRGSVSVGSVAVDLAEQIFSHLSECKVMILGAGETSEKTAKCLQARGAQQIFVANRSFERAAILAEQTGSRAIRFNEWAAEFEDLDILISSTSAPHAILTAEKLQPVLRTRRDRPLFIIDLAVPRDVAPDAHHLDGVFVYDLDSLQAIAAQTLQTRKDEAERCEEVILKQVGEFQLWMVQNCAATLGSTQSEVLRFE
ncbi:MAG: glutamyl-tRNA reductase [Verrucomicrobia bacterium]|nr:glutamyl-tRNA reductase [Verrucomicrobiota bacterium]